MQFVIKHWRPVPKLEDKSTFICAIDESPASLKALEQVPATHPFPTPHAHACTRICTSHAIIACGTFTVPIFRIKGNHKHQG
jgi:hypothetical protein